MNNEGLNRTSNVVKDPTQETQAPLRVNVDVLKQRLIQQQRETPLRVNVDVLKQRLIEQQRKDRVKRTIILSTVVVSLGALTVLTY